MKLKNSDSFIVIKADKTVLFHQDFENMGVECTWNVEVCVCVCSLSNISSSCSGDHREFRPQGLKIVVYNASQ